VILLSGALVSFLLRRVELSIIGWVSKGRRVQVQRVEVVSAALWVPLTALALWGLGAGEPVLLAIPAYGGALLLERVDGYLLARADESIQNIMRNRRR
jgi:hypothetical protein